MSKFAFTVIALSLAAFLGGGGYTLLPRSLSDPACNIKGNISIDSGRRIYHMPRQMFYRQTVIRPQYGERWFCTEDEARAAGWVKARR
ncbi:MAG TPA: hypothetical protein VK181_03275 [Rhizobium sp.]|nr:hypothetical protein [Rhizobium sp.]